MELVSVIIPVFNGARTLRACLNSVLAQDYSNYEVIVVDNNSTDETVTIIHEFTERHDNFRYVFEKRKSIPQARNRGVAVAKGDIIAMTDSDCVVPADWLTKLVARITNDHEDIVMGLDYSLFNDYWSRNIKYSSDIYWRQYQEGNYVEMLDTKNFSART